MDPNPRPDPFSPEHASPEGASPEGASPEGTPPESAPPELEPFETPAPAAQAPVVERWAPPAPPAPAPVAPAAGDPTTQGRLLDQPLTLVRLALLFYGVVAVFAIGFAIFSGHARTLLGEGPPRLQHLLAGLGVGLVLVAASRVAVQAWKPFARASETASKMLGPITLREALILALLSGVAEELLFRGALWPTLKLAGTTLLFGLVHVAPRRALWVYPLFAALCGLLLGLLRDGTGSVIPPMLAHMVVNGFNLVWLGGKARDAQRAAAAQAAPPTSPA